MLAMILFLSLQWEVSMWFKFMQNLSEKSHLNSWMFDFDKIQFWSTDKKWKFDGFEIMAGSMWGQRFSSKAQFIF